jgi:hypothetical protein
MICYRDRAYCSSKVKVHTCGREFTDEDQKNAEKWWGGKDFPLCLGEFCTPTIKESAEKVKEDFGDVLQELSIK